MNKLIIPMRRGFSLIEILFAIFILGIGLLMVAAVFPVAIKWTNQDVQSTIGLVISRSAVAQIKANPTVNNASIFSEELLPLASGGVYATYPQPYMYGTPQPVPAPGLLQGTATSPPDYANYLGLGTDYRQARYWWQAVLLPAPADGAAGVASTPIGTQAGAATTTYNLYILVFAKGDLSNVYNPPLSINYPQVPQIAVKKAAAAATDMPIVSIGLYLKPVPVNGNPPVTYMGNSVRSENLPTNPPTVGFSGSNSVGINDVLLFAPPAVNQQTSPLVYIYATTVTF